MDNLNGLGEESILDFGLSGQDPEELALEPATEDRFAGVDDCVLLVVGVDDAVISFSSCRGESSHVDVEVTAASYGLNRCSNSATPAQAESQALVVHLDESILALDHVVVNVDALGEQFERDQLVSDDLVPATCIPGHLKVFLGSDRRTPTEAKCCLGFLGEKNSGECRDFLHHVD